jgi:asparagine synthase (glutamine-hydrolysing)
MCGIYGAYNPTTRLSEETRAWAVRAREALRHRGPDGEDCQPALDGRCLLGHTRLAIIDLEGGMQPLFNEDLSVSVVCNGEIYNYIELRQQLIEKGHRFHTHSDCEVLVHLYEDKGTEFLNDLEGMYAFALVDARNDRLFLARDRFGEKPLYWTSLPGGTVAFASELKALLSVPGLKKELDVAAIAQFLALRYIPAPRTHVLAVSKLRAGEALLADASSAVRIWRYWVPDFPENGHRRYPSKQEAIERIQEDVRESVRLRLRSDVPVGAFLSGGIDSTYIAIVARELQPSVKLRTFCATFDDDELNEGPYARMIADAIGSEHCEVHLCEDDILSSFEALIDHYDEPFADASMFPTYAVCRAARAECKVMLSGDGGDECFAGYREFFRYYSLHGLRRLRGVRAAAQAARLRWGKTWRGIGLLEFLSQDDWTLLYPEAQRERIADIFLDGVRAPAQEGLDELRFAAARHARLPYPVSAIESMTEGYLPEQILVKVDRASMRSALECRAPFLDRRLMASVHSLPEAYHFEHGMGKALLRRALPDWVPDTIRWRQKRGFTPPLASWLRRALRTWAEGELRQIPPVLSEVLNPTPAQQLFEEHQAGSDRSDQLFRWLVLIRRCRELQPA